MTQSMREFAGGDLKNCEIVGASTQIGVRESRRIKGEYILTEEDAMNGQRFDDVIAWRSGWLDVGFTRLSQMKIHQVPYRALLPEKMDGLLAAGRCISATHVGAASGKSMGNCFATGHAAGIAAAIAVKKKQIPREVEVKSIQEILAADGVDLSKGGETQSKNIAN
jgi:succinate dehydrogenase/fumarate reductase flavoprotein subunit